MAERSFSQLPIRRMMNTRRGVFPVSEYWIHAIPVIIFLCFFTLWFFSHSVSNGEIMSSVRLLEKPMAVRNESHVSLAVLAASSAVSPLSGNHTVIAARHNETRSRNGTEMPAEVRKGGETEAKGKKKKSKKKGGRKEKMEKDVVDKSKSVKKAKKSSLAG